MPSNKKLLQAAAGNAGESLYVEDVFSTYLYDGNGANRSITNGIDLAGEGGLVWAKMRSGTPAGGNNVLYDTERGAGKYLISDLNSAQSATDSVALTSFNSNGFSLGVDNASGLINYQTRVYASWTFRKAEKFFDVVTWTGDGSSSRTIPHNLNGEVGSLILKRTDNSSSWSVYHKSTGVSQTLLLEDTAAAFGASGRFGSSAPTTTTFDINSIYNVSGATYVAYLFASDAGGFGDDDESIIKCGSYTGNGSSQEITLGFEPQFLLIKSTTISNSTTDWVMVDVMRGTNFTPSISYPFQILRSNESTAEGPENGIAPTATGFFLSGGNDFHNGTGGGYIYIAIRRPMKTPESGTEVFGISAGGTTSPGFISSFPVDAAIGVATTASNHYLSSRLTNKNYMLVTSTAAEVANSYFSYTFQNGYYDSTSGATQLAYMFKRATGFFDVVAYTGTGVDPMAEPHNLGVVPELIIIKNRSNSEDWNVFTAFGGTARMFLNTTAAETATGWTGNIATATEITLGTGFFNNNASYNYIAYLFATLAGVSKVGSYTGTGSNVDVDCGFSAGARFILIKRSDSTGDWYVYDSLRGITAGNDPYLLLNSTAAEVTGTDYIDPLSSGFTVTSSASSTVNVSSGSYIFLAIA